MNTKGQTSVFYVILIVILFGVFFAYALAPTLFVASDISLSLGAPTGILGFFVAYLPYFVLLAFVVVGVLWKIFAG